MEEYKVGFIGHRDTRKTRELRRRLRDLIESLIVNENATVFIFGGTGKFDDLAYKVVTELKKKYPHIIRKLLSRLSGYVDGYYRNFIFGYYDRVEFPEFEVDSEGNVYSERDRAMIDTCDVLVVYYNENVSPRFDVQGEQTESGTKLAVKYALSKKKRVVNLFREQCEK